MIGQERLKLKINRWNELPRFLILNGTKYSGRKTLAKYISNKFNAQLIIIGNKIDEIRQMIKLANEYDTDIIFFIDDGNKLSLGAENTLLKITEEAPNNSHIILSVENKDLLLPTIKSRGEIFNLSEYTVDGYITFIKENNLLDDEKLKNINVELLPVAYPNLGYINYLDLSNYEYLVNYCEQIITHIRNASISDSFKVTEKLKLKDEQDGWDIRQFIYCLNKCCRNKLTTSLLNKNTKEYNYQLSYIKILTDIERMLSNSLFNKSYIIDNLIIAFKRISFE